LSRPTGPNQLNSGAFLAKCMLQNNRRLALMSQITLAPHGTNQLPGCQQWVSPPRKLDCFQADRLLRTI
jgi:hypothetical protein